MHFGRIDIVREFVANERRERVATFRVLLDERQQDAEGFTILRRLQVARKHGLRQGDADVERERGPEEVEQFRSALRAEGFVVEEVADAMRNAPSMELCVYLGLAFDGETGVDAFAHRLRVVLIVLNSCPPKAEPWKGLRRASRDTTQRNLCGRVPGFGVDGDPRNLLGRRTKHCLPLDR
jgi:hypothetical protein